MRKLPLHLTLLVSFLTSMISYAAQPKQNNFYFTHIAGDDGLSQSNVKSIIQDSYGFMWFGTKNGLNRYDGTTIRVINCHDYNKDRGNNNISALYEDNRKRLWIGTDKGIFIYDPITELFDFQDIQTETGAISMYNWISDIKADKAGNIWIVIPNQGVFRWNNEKLYHYYITDQDNYSEQNPECICIRRNGEVWIGTNHAGLFRYNPADDTFTQYFTDNKGNALAEQNIYSICEYGDYIAIAIHEGELKKLHIPTGEISQVHAPGVHYSVIRDVECYNGKLWVGTQAGLFIVNEQNHEVTHIDESPMNPYGLTDKAIYCIYKDRQEGLWLGTLFGGVNYSANRNMEFTKYFPSNNSPSLSSKRIHELIEDERGRIWIGTEDDGINMLDPQTGIIRPVAHETLLANNALNSLGMMIRDSQLWCGFFKKGLYTIDINTGKASFYGQDHLGLDEASLYAIYTDSQGRTWLGNAWGIYVAEAGSMDFRKLRQLGNFWVVDILEDQDGTMWFASMGVGICKYNPAEDEYTFYSSDENDPESLSSNTVSSITRDSKGRLWFATDRGGMCVYNKHTNKFRSYSIEDGLPDDVTYKAIEDDLGNIWFGTNRGLVRLNPETDEVRVYTKDDGLLGNQFNYKSGLKSKSGLLYFGGIDGLISFDPTQEKSGTFNAPLYITRLSIYNREVTLHEQHTPLKQNILFTSHITLPHNQSHLSFDFAALSYPTQVKYRYRMQNLDKDWITANTNTNITYSKLPPGHYEFHIQATDAASGWQNCSSNSLHITILPPWWLSSWAYTLYTILALALFGLTLYWYIRRQNRRVEESQRLFEIEKEKELHQAKVEFFTEIAHEVRTPLTLISGPLETIMEMNLKEPALTHNLNVIRQNTDRLLELTRQLLDFRKVGASKFLLNFIMVDVARLATETVARFEPTYTQQQKKISLSVQSEAFQAAADKEALTKILSNLLNNALKYSRSIILVEVRKDTTTFTVRVSNDGNKIPLELHERVFEPFYQIHQKDESRGGAGIGLPLSRSLAELHKGRLYVDPAADMTTFVLTLPLHQEKVIHLEDISTQNEYIQPPGDATAEPELKNFRILLVEDNQSMLSFISEKLRETFIVETASNGAEALELLRTENIDLIISDVMMPEMNGMEFCRRVKSDIEFSHIPFIFLTAHNDLESKINGLKTGAEAYIEKPFSFTHLKTQVISLLTNRQKEREAFAKRPFFPVHNMRMNKADEEFMDKIINLIHQNITDDNFSVERLADILCMSRSSLLRKIKVLTNLSPVDFIRLIRLKKAAELIQEGKQRIGEICYMVGINSPSYFSKLFQRQFGMTPKEFEKQNRITGETEL